MITARTPAAGATGVAVVTTVTATFDEPVTGTTLTLAPTAGGTNIAGTTAYNTTTRTITLTPTTALATNTNYTATLTAATDTAGNTIAPTTWTFTTATADTTAPVVTARTPAQAADRGRRVDHGVGHLRRSRHSAPHSPSPPAGGTHHRHQRLQHRTRTITLTPTSALATNTNYTATLTAATDTAGNTIAPTTWTFTTHRTAPTDTSYIASYHAPNGRYAITASDSPPRHQRPHHPHRSPPAPRRQRSTTHHHPWHLPTAPSTRQLLRRRPHHPSHHR